MEHTHRVFDADQYLTINPHTREIQSSSAGVKLIQGDHNSEQVTFAVPRYVEGHDMSECSKIEVHFNNISADKKQESRDVYLVDDVAVSPDSDDVVTFSWLISGNATKYAGILSFLIRFECLTGDTIDYAWHTSLYNDITVGEGMNNGESVVTEYSDVLEAWKAEVLETWREEVRTEVEVNLGIVQTPGNSETEVMSQKATTDYIGQVCNIYPATFEDGWIESRYSPVKITPRYDNASYKHCIIECDYKDVFILTGTGGNGARLWAFTDSGYNVIEVSDANQTVDQLRLEAPANATHLIINVNHTLPHQLLIGELFDYYKVEVDERFGALNASIEETKRITNKSKFIAPLGYLDVNNGKIASTPYCKGCIFEAEHDTEYRITVNGYFNRFIISGTKDTECVVGGSTERISKEYDNVVPAVTKDFVFTNTDYNFIILNLAAIYEGSGLTAEEFHAEVTVEKNPSVSDFEVNGIKTLTAQELWVGEAYTTKRDVRAVDTAEELYALYDALVSEFPLYITKNELGADSQGTKIYEYVFTTGDYNAKGGNRNPDAVTAKPSILVCNVHGKEAGAVMGIYQLFRDMAKGSSKLSNLREGVTFKVIPLAVPYSFTNKSRPNANGVNINRNFDANWALTAAGNDYSGATAADQVETQIVQAWIDANTTAKLFLDVHNSGYTNEITYLAANNATEGVAELKRKYFKGMDAVIPYWKTEQGIGEDNIFSYTGSFEGFSGMSYMYADKKGLLACILECSNVINSHDQYQPETIAVAAEAIGNMLLGIDEKA